MNLAITFAAQIKAHGAAHGLDYSRDEIESLTVTLNSVARLDLDRHIAFDIGRGPVSTLDQALTTFAAGMGRPAAVETAAPSIPANATATERAIAVNAAAKAGSDALKQKQATDLVQTYGNPWRTGNATHRAYITNTHPTLAARLRAEAGARP